MIPKNNYLIDFERSQDRLFLQEIARVETPPDDPADPVRLRGSGQQKAKKLKYEPLEFKLNQDSSLMYERKKTGTTSEAKGPSGETLIDVANSAKPDLELDLDAPKHDFLIAQKDKSFQAVHEYIRR